VAAAAFGGAAMVALPYQGLGLPDLVWAATAAGAAAASVLRWREDGAVRQLPAPPPGARSVLSGFSVGRSAIVLAGQVTARFEARGSSAAPLLRRLDRAARAMDVVVNRLGGAAESTRREAADAEFALRSAASRLVAVERAAAVAPADAQARLDAGALTLCTGLADGVTAYERLVAAAGECVAADSLPDGIVLRRLTDATDALRGLAAGLAETTRISGAYTR
jgi:hypothetical protein